MTQASTTVCLTFDSDALSVWLGSDPSLLRQSSRGEEYGARIPEMSCPPPFLFLTTQQNHSPNLWNRFWLLVTSGPIIPALRGPTKNGAARSRAWSCWKARSNTSCQQVARMGDVALPLTAAEEG